MTMTAHLHAPTPEEARDLARRVGQTMFAVDTASKDTMGMELVSCEPGRAVMRMTVRELHLNGHQICHGGFIFTLSDSTFAFASTATTRTRWPRGPASSSSNPVIWATC